MADNVGAHDWPARIRTTTTTTTTTTIHRERQAILPKQKEPNVYSRDHWSPFAILKKGTIMNTNV